MKKFFTIGLLLLVLIGCQTKTASDTELNIGVSFYPMKDILELVESDLNEAGYTLNIHEFSDYQTPNNLLKDNELDANMIQHQYFLEAFNKANDADLEVIMPIYHATYALYAKDITDLNDVPDGATITLADDATNLSRALYLLDQAGLIEVDKTNATSLTLEDVISNPKNLVLTDQVPLTSLSQRYVETGMSVMYPTYARNLELVGDEQRLYTEITDSVTEGYAISLVSRPDLKDADKIQKLMEVLNSDKVRDFLIENYDWASKPAF